MYIINSKLAKKMLAFLMFSIQYNHRSFELRDAVDQKSR